MGECGKTHFIATPLLCGSGRSSFSSPYLEEPRTSAAHIYMSKDSTVVFFFRDISAARGKCGVHALDREPLPPGLLSPRYRKKSLIPFGSSPQSFLISNGATFTSAAIAPGRVVALTTSKMGTYVS